MASKTYTIPYNDESKSWEPCEVRARVIKSDDRKPSKLFDSVKVEDAADSPYAAIGNNVLLIESTTIEARIEAGDQARITLRLNDGDARIKEVLKRNARFKLKVTLNPEIDGGAGGAPKPGPDVEGFCLVLAELPQTWNLVFRKTVWAEEKFIDLKKVEGVPPADLQALGDWGGRLILRPRGILQDEKAGETIESTKVIGKAGECTLDRGEGNTVKGEWDENLQAYIFQIEPAQKGEAPAGAGGKDLEIRPPIRLNYGWERQLLALLKAAGKTARLLAPEILPLARRFIQGTMDLVAEKSEQEIVERKTDLSTWLLNIGNFVVFIAQATELFAKALWLHREAFKRFMDNIINLAIELIFSFFDLLSYAWKYAKGSLRDALKQSTKELVEELAEKSVKELASQKEVLEQGVNAARRSIGSMDQQLDHIWRQFPRDLSNPTELMLKQMDDLTAQAKAIMAQRDQLLEQMTKSKRQIADLQANLMVAQEIKENAGQATEKEFLEKLKAKALEIPNSPQMQQLVKDLEQMQIEDLAKLEKWQEQIRRLIDSLPANTEPEVRRRAELTLAAVAQFREAFNGRTLIDFNKETFSTLLEEQPIGERLKTIHQNAQKAKEAGDQIKYENMAWEHYKGFFSPLWWFMDWSVAQIVWLYSLARERWPWLKRAEEMIVAAVDTFLGFFMPILNAMLDFMHSHHWRRSCISPDLRAAGVSEATGRGVTPEFFNFPQTAVTLVQDCDPHKVHALGSNGSQGQAQAAKSKMLLKAEGSYRREQEAQRQQVRRLFISLCTEALDVNNLHQPAPEQVRSGSYTSVCRQLLTPMTGYEQSFAAANAQGTDYVVSLGTFMQNSNYQDWDGAIEWLTWAIAWGLRLGALLSLFSVGAAPWAPALLGAAQGAEWIGGFLRPAAAWLGTLPDIVGFQYDVAIAAALAFQATTKGGVDLDTMIVEPYSVD